MENTIKVKNDKLRKKWLIISCDDERYDIDLEVQTFEGSLEEFEKSDICLFFSSEDRTEWRDGCYIYKTVKRTKASDCDLNIQDLEKVEVVHFMSMMLIPFDNFNDINYLFQQSIVDKKLKFGFLDIKKG